MQFTTLVSLLSIMSAVSASSLKVERKGNAGLSARQYDTCYYDTDCGLYEYCCDGYCGEDTCSDIYTCYYDSDCGSDEYCCDGYCQEDTCDTEHCEKDSDCSGGANCCSEICHFGSCRMDGTCDADNDCYGWCGNDDQAICVDDHCLCSHPPPQ